MTISINLQKYLHNSKKNTNFAAQLTKWQTYYGHSTDKAALWHYRQ